MSDDYPDLSGHPFHPDNVRLETGDVATKPAKRFEDKTSCFYDLTHAALAVHVLAAGGAITRMPPKTPESGAVAQPLRWGYNADFPAPPEIGARVHIRMNDLGAGTVEAYFIEHGWVGVCVKLDRVPQWKQDQQDKRRAEVALVFATEIRPEQ